MTLSEVVDRLASGRLPTSYDMDVLRRYAQPTDGLVIEDQLDRLTVELTADLTERDASDVCSPVWAAAALLATLPS